jgi:LysR family hydrogen peroxide-inducible transcriptional activator
MDITLRQLKYLIALADEGHFSRAAQAANVSQPALSVQIREMEDRLGVQLVERHPRRIGFTPAGRDVLTRARRIIDELAELTQAARRDRGLGGPLRLGVIPTVAPYLLPAALPLLRARNVLLDLGVREAQTQALLDELARGALDAAVIASPPSSDELAALPLFQDRFLLAGSARQVARLGARRLRPEQMGAERLLLLDDGHCLADQALAACALTSAVRSSTRIDLRASSLSTLCRLAEAGFGLTFVPELALRAETAAAPGLGLLRFAAPEPGRTVSLVRRRVSAEDGWFREVAGLLAQAGQAEINHARAMLPGPLPQGGPAQDAS